MKLRLLMVPAVIGIVLLAGCAGVMESREYKAYKDEMKDLTLDQRFAIALKDWALDLSDVFSMEIGAGEYIGADVQATELGQGGALFGRVMKYGWRDRAWGYYDERRQEGGASWFYYRDMHMTPLTGNEQLFKRRRLMQDFPIRHNDDWHWMDCGFEVGFIFGGTSAHVSPKQTLDFAISTISLPFELTLKPILYECGVRTPEIDVCQDDTAAQMRREKHPEVETIEHPDGFPPIEYLDERLRLPY